MSDFRTILAVDDTESNLDILIAMLHDHDVIPATNGFDALEIAQNEEIDLILLDIVMPKPDGFEVCIMLKENPKTKDIPVIFLTGKSDEDSIERAYDIGGADYVTKPFKPKELLARVKTQLNLKKSISELEFLASRDPMTGILNRRKFFELAKPLFSESKRAVFASMIDIDKFKLINDRYGHDIGDVVIKSVVNTINEALPSGAIFGRMGGEEFAILLECENQSEMVVLFEGIKESVSSLGIEAKGEKLSFTISNGIAHKKDETKTIDELLKEADMALYDAKGSGRNRVIFR